MFCIHNKFEFLFCSFETGFVNDFPEQSSENYFERENCYYKIW